MPIRVSVRMPMHASIHMSTEAIPPTAAVSHSIIESIDDTDVIYSLDDAIADRKKICMQTALLDTMTTMYSVGPERSWP